MPYIAIYGSITECLEACDRTWQAGKRTPTIRVNGRFPDRSYSDSWVGRKLDSWEHVKEACVQEWKEGLDIIEGMLYEIDKLKHTLPPPVDRRRRRVWSPDDGDDLDLDRLRSGQDYWQKCQRVTTRAPAPVTIISSMSTSCYRSAESVMWRGAAAIVISDLLEKSGYRVDLWSCDCVTGGLSRSRYGDSQFIGIRLKDTQMPLDISSVVNGTSGWFFRTVGGFQTLHCCDYDVPNVGYGCPEHLSSSHAKEPLSRMIGNSTKVVIVDGVWDLKAALTKVTEVILELNKETTHAD